jgi:signal transduction histidine kinase
MAQFEVHDTGPGMARAEVERVFEPFARGQGEGAGATGTGLGLTIAKMLTDLMGGEMNVRSAPGEGCVFTVRLFLPELREAPPARPLAVQPKGYVGGRRRVLVVDNEEADRELLQRWLAPLGFKVQLATSGLHALALLDGLAPDEPDAPHAIFLDLAMPGIDGWETRRRLRARGWGGVPLAIVSANAFDKGLHVELDGEDGVLAQDFIVKPVRRDELLAWLAQRLELRWIGAEATPVAAPPQTVRPAREEIEPLLELVRLGYTRGILQWLDDWVRRRPEHAALAAALAALAREFRFEAIEQKLNHGDA